MILRLFMLSAALLAPCLPPLSPLAGAEPASFHATAGYRSLVSAGAVELLFYPVDRKVAQRYRDWCDQFIPRPEFIRGRALPGTRVFIAPSEEEFQRLSGGMLPEWGVACAFPEEGVVIVRSPRLVPLWREDPREILFHELAHIALARVLPEARVPRWFHEGYAVYSAQMWGPESWLEFSLAILVRKVQPLAQLRSDFPAEEARARRAYLQSYTVVEYIFTRWDDSQLELLFSRWNEQGDLDQALRQTLGLTLDQLEGQWMQWAQGRYGWMTFLTDFSVIWILGGGLFIAVYVIRRRAYRKRLAEMERIERMLEPAPGPWSRHVLPYHEQLEPREQGEPDSPQERDREPGEPPRPDGSAAAG